jgi:hypothetical protein
MSKLAQQFQQVSRRSSITLSQEHSCWENCWSCNDNTKTSSSSSTSPQQQHSNVSDKCQQLANVTADVRILPPKRQESITDLSKFLLMMEQSEPVRPMLQQRRSSSLSTSSSWSISSSQTLTTKRVRFGGVTVRSIP